MAKDKKLVDLPIAHLITVLWSTAPGFMRRLFLYCEFLKKHGRSPRQNEKYRGLDLGRWTATTRSEMNTGKLPPERIRVLKHYGFRDQADPRSRQVPKEDVTKLFVRLLKDDDKLDTVKEAKKLKVSKSMIYQLKWMAGSLDLEILKRTLK